ncbi:MAG TPA: DinB family protein [Spirochaetia bacterium]|nr:DinB family protein [Spirochaetia bacterium]
MAFYETVISQESGWGWEVPVNVPESIREVVASLYQMKRNILHSVAGLPEDQVWSRIGPDVSAIGNLLMHVRGSEHQWIGHKIGHRPLKRDRNQEFAQRGGISLKTLIEDLGRVDRDTREILGELSEETIKGFRSADGCSIPFILHYTNHHLAVHLGQIIAVREFLRPGYRLYGSPEPAAQP